MTKNKDQTVTDNSDEGDAANENGGVTRNTVNELSLLTTVKNFFKNNGLVKSSPKAPLKKEEKSNGKHVSLNKKPGLLSKNGDETNGLEVRKNGFKETKHQVNRSSSYQVQRTANGHEETTAASRSGNSDLENWRPANGHQETTTDSTCKSDHDIFLENWLNNVLQNNVNQSNESEMTHDYENWPLQTSEVKESSGNSFEERTLHTSPENQISESNGETENLIMNKKISPRRSANSIPFQRNISTNDRHTHLDIKIPFNRQQFITRNVRKIFLTNRHSGGTVILNRDGMNVNFTELKSDMEPIYVRIMVQRRLSTPSLMSGGCVISKELSDEFINRNFYNDNPVVHVELPENLYLETFEMPTSKVAIVPSAIERSCSGGGIIDVKLCVTVSFPELFPISKIPMRTRLQQTLSSGGRVIEPEAQNEILIVLS